MEINVNNVNEKMIYGRVQVTVPMHIKIVVMSWVRKSGMRKAEFLRTAFLIGAQQLATSVNAKTPNENYSNHDEQSVNLRGMGAPDR
jgi:hypothetical protein